MTNEDLLNLIQNKIDEDKITVNLIQNEDIEQYDIVVCGAFNPYFEIESISTPIEIDIHTHKKGAEISWIEAQDILDEFNQVLRHELIHLEQYTEDRFDFENIESNEKEAYAKEKQETPWYRNITL